MTNTDLPRRIDACSTEAACRRILERHRDQIETQKVERATANLGRIIEAVLKLSTRQGFHGTSLRDIARVSGLSMGALYSYFGSKENLLYMILNEVMDTVKVVLQDKPDSVDSNPQLHLRWLIETHLKLTELMLPWFVFAYMEAKSFPDTARRLAMESELATEAIFAEVLTTGIATGHFKICNVELTASLIKPLLQDWYIKRAKYGKRRVTLNTYTETVIGFVESSICESHFS